MAKSRLASYPFIFTLVLTLAGCNGDKAGVSVSQGTLSPSARLSELKIENWGPQRTKAGEGFNLQPGGVSAFWVRANYSLDGTDAVLVLNDVKLKSAISGNLITAFVPSNLYKNTGNYHLHIDLHVGKASRRSADVNFIVE